MVSLMSHAKTDLIQPYLVCLTESTNSNTVLSLTMYTSATVKLKKHAPLTADLTPGCYRNMELLLLLQDTKQVERDDNEHYSLPLRNPKTSKMPRKGEDSNNVKGKEAGRGKK